ncbi:MAG TPA: alpha/beta hydrolase [Candidatus Limnocylindrales bacterium]|nr:alpha/beta hydrolase [Candidatus Limnocylindrales bacterium]
MTPLHPQVRLALDAGSAETPHYLLPIEKVRRLADAGALASGGPPEPMASISNVTIGGDPQPLPAVLYRATPEAAAGVLVYYHGGGFASGSVAGYDRRLRRLARWTGWEVLGVDYRLAPEHPFPAAVDDAERAFRWAQRVLSEGRPVVAAGDSAGGALAAVVSRRLRDADGPIPAGTVMLYPVTDMGHGPRSFAYDSYELCATGYGLTRAHMDWYRSMYVHGGTLASVSDLSPVLAPDLGGLPPALVITAEYDLLRDEGELYARRLAEAGVPTRLRRFEGHVHGFIGDPRLDDSAVALDEIRRFLAEEVGQATGST